MTRLHHVAVGAQRVEALAAFYREALGLPESARHRAADGSLRSIWLDLEGTLLMLEQSDEPPRPVRSIGCGPFLIALCVTPDQRVTLEARLLALGHPIESRTLFTSYLRDPEGNRVALSHYPTPAADSSAGSAS